MPPSAVASVPRRDYPLCGGATGTNAPVQGPLCTESSGGRPLLHFLRAKIRAPSRRGATPPRAAGARARSSYRGAALGVKESKLKPADCHEHRRQAVSQHLAGDRWLRRGDRPDQAAARVGTSGSDRRGCGARDQQHDRARRAADRRHRRLWRVPGAARGSLRRGARPRRGVAGPARPTAVNLRWALEAMRDAVRNRPRERARRRPPTNAPRRFATRTSRPAGASASTASGLPGGSRGARKRAGRSTSSPTAMPAGSPASTGARPLAPIYMAHDRGIPLHVWVDETRPRNQGASLTAFELGSHGVPHTHHRRQRRRPSDAAGAGRSLPSSAPTA